MKPPIRLQVNKHTKGRDFEIGRILHLKSEIRNLELDWQSNLKFRISDLRCRIRPISKFLPVTGNHENQSPDRTCNVDRGTCMGPNRFAWRARLSPSSSEFD